MAIEIVHDGSARQRASIATLIVVYKTLYQQESVLLVRLKANTCF